MREAYFGNIFCAQTSSVSLAGWHKKLPQAEAISCGNYQIKQMFVDFLLINLSTKTVPKQWNISPRELKAEIYSLPTQNLRFDTICSWHKAAWCKLTSRAQLLGLCELSDTAVPHPQLVAALWLGYNATKLVQYENTETLCLNCSYNPGPSQYNSII